MTPFELTAIALLGAIELSNLVLHFQNRNQMNRLEELSAAFAAIRANVERILPIAAGAGQRLDPEALGPIIAAANAINDTINAAVPPQ